MKTGPLSFGQERLWFLNRLDPDDPSYNCSYVYRLRGALDVAALESAFTQVAARHESLRTRFEEVDGRPVAIVEPPGPITVERVDASSEEDARSLVSARTNALFDLSADPPFRVSLIRLGPDDHVLCVVLHHINGDGWSLNVLREEVAGFYAGADEPEPPPQYLDHARAQRGSEVDLGWWVSRLAGTPVLELPADRPRPAVRGTAGGEVRFRLDPDLVAEVGRLAASARCTPFMVLLAAYQVLLSRHSGRADFCVGVPSSGRTSTELERMIGYLSTTMVLRCDLSGAPAFDEMLRRTRKGVLQALSHPDVPVERLITELGLERDLSKTPLFQTLFAVHTQGDLADPLPGVAAEPFPHGWHPARHDLSLDLYPEPDGSLLGVAIYSRELFDPDTAERLARRFVTLLRSIVADPARSTAELELMPPEERAQLAAWNDTRAELPESTVVDLILAQARRRPDALAVGPLTYRELVERAAGLAVRLRGRGVGRGDLVAVRLSRGPLMVVALLGVAMSGAAYLPVDPEYPQARVDYVIEDSGAALVLTDADLDAEPSPVVPDPPRPGDTAYVLYTSGSTGRPKGVVIQHRALTNFLLAMRTLLDAAQDDVWLGLTSLSFDISALELYLPLVTGGRLVVADADTARDGAALAGLVRAEGVTHVQATPSGWRVLMAGDLPPVTALAGGEPLPLKLAAGLRSRVRRLINMYGPTETTIWSTAWEVPEHPGRVTIGHPIANTTVHVVDAQGTDVPVGVPGELLIGGAGLATGYLGRPELTAERFVRHAGERVYRTGDLVRRLPDGALEFLGRTDNQVKLRGHRVELGEIEAVLESHQQVRQAVAAVRDDLLVAYVVGGDPEDVRAHASAHLPAYMVPSAVVALEALPLTPNGKVDRKALPDVAPARPASRPPRTPSEHLVAEVFSDVLGVGEVGADDDFFALGGHSLLATAVIGRLPAALAVRELFLHPTVAGLAEALDLAATAGRPGPVPRPAGAPAVLSRNQERLWFLQRLDPGDASYNMWIVRRLRGRLDPVALGRAVDALVARHESLRTRVLDVDGVPTALVEPPGPVPVETVAADSLAQAEALVAERTNRPFDLAAAPAFRVSLIRLADDDHVLCVVLHHVLGDGSSLNILLGELAALYSGLELPAPALQFADVAAWQREQDQAPLAEHWARRLAGLEPLDLPTDRPRDDATRRVPAFHTVRLPAEEAERLAATARARGATLFMALLAAYQAVLAAQCGTPDLAVATVVSGRDRPELGGVVGYLADSVVIRGDLSGRPAFGDLLERTRDAVLDAFAHRDVPLDEPPAFETMLILHTQDTDLAPPVFSGLEAAPFAHGFAQIKFDLMAEAWQDAHELLIVFSYDAALFDQGTVQALAARMERVLRTDPAAEPELLSHDDTRVLLELGEGPALGAAVPVPELVAAAVREHGDRPAVGALSYRELDVRVGELAGILQAGGVVPGDVVGVLLGRSEDAIAALLAAWRAGAAYLPLDPEHPEERLAFVLGDSGARLVLTTPDLADRLPAGTPLAYTCQSAPAPEPVPPGEAAYVIYTSGSTGVPKGVVVEHRNLAVRVAWMLGEYGLGPGDRVVQFASLGFDTHAEEIYPALAAGAHLRVLPDGAVTLPDHLDGVSVLDLPTAYWHHLVDQLDAVAWPDGLRLVILGGEQAQEAAVRRWRERFGARVRLLNTYGPTETTVIATAAELDGRPGRPPIGRPIAATRAYVVDPAGRLAPPGARGELWIGGDGVARGYLGRPKLTAERFIEFDGGRVYRTGDLARWLPGGQLEFLWRVDDQVKVRGYRIEPGEIEARILAFPGSGEVAVVAVEEILAGYVTGEADFAELSRHLAATLPPYMVPTAWVRLERLPLTVNGKVDRAALPRPQAVTRRYVAPRGDAEELVADVYGEVLGVARVGALDDFFALGGHSLTAMRVVARLRAAVGLEVPIRALFAAPTVEALARTVEDLVVAELDQMSDEEAERLVRELS
ncbi:non-ribosomal peptide synthetase [Nonomuraea sediminis]|uniref:non-ribosomal peptide synthetase n=1 Tax=Nonomuraea sediminis TaxID=2835864 RepID=UPI001BDC0AF8|nr:non-ribosomal peptide synthetase [Nonomuraea sediminis]